MSLTKSADANLLLEALGLREIINVNDVHDNSHSFAELYEHRSVLFMSLLNALELVDLSSFGDRQFEVVKSKFHADGSNFEDYFIVMLTNLRNKEQISYHLEINKYWDMCPGKEVESAPEWDGHTSDDVVARLISWFL